MCDAGGVINWPTTIGNLGLWTEPGISTKATRLETHQTVRFFCLGFPALLGFVLGVPPGGVLSGFTTGCFLYLCYLFLCDV